MNIFLIIIIIILFLILLISFFVMNKYKQLSECICKINESDKLINENLKNKLELTTRCINIITRELKIESKKFDEVKKIKKDKIDSFNLDSILENSSEEILEIKDDYKELSNIKSFDGLIDDINEANINLTAYKSFYNKYAELYNELIKTFPLNIISKIKKYNIKLTYDVNIEKIDSTN